MKKYTVIIPVLFLFSLFIFFSESPKKEVKVARTETRAHWLVLYRKSNYEELYFGLPGNKKESTLIKRFIVKTGIPGERPTPLPGKLGREYWVITDEYADFENPETAPYFLTLNIPVSADEPYGPSPYNECNGQCNWVLPGAFGLHGTGGNPDKLSPQDPGSSGCIRHADEDITYLYDLLDPQKEEVRYYIQDK